jgi:hypothetical protein
MTPMPMCSTCTSASAKAAADSEQTPRVHVPSFEHGLANHWADIINARWLLEREGELTVALPEQVHVSSSALAPVLAPAV